MHGFNIITLAGFYNQPFSFIQIVYIDDIDIKMYNGRQIINSRANINIRRISIECRA